LDTFKPDSAKKEAHWLMDCSEAPEHIIMTTKIQNNFMENKLRTGRLSSFSPRVLTGTRVKNMALNNGTKAQSKGR
jgi:hypothetical protein